MDFITYILYNITLIHQYFHNSVQEVYITDDSELCTHTTDTKKGIKYCCPDCSHDLNQVRYGLIPKQSSELEPRFRCRDCHKIYINNDAPKIIVYNFKHDSVRTLCRSCCAGRICSGSLTEPTLNYGDAYNAVAYICNGMSHEEIINNMSTILDKFQTSDFRKMMSTRSICAQLPVSGSAFMGLPLDVQFYMVSRFGFRKDPDLVEGILNAILPITSTYKSVDFVGSIDSNEHDVSVDSWSTSNLTDYYESDDLLELFNQPILGHRLNSDLVKMVLDYDITPQKFTVNLLCSVDDVIRNNFKHGKPLAFLVGDDSVDLNLTTLRNLLSKVSSFSVVAEPLPNTVSWNHSLASGLRSKLSDRGISTSVPRLVDYNGDSVISVHAFGICEILVGQILGKDGIEYSYGVVSEGNTTYYTSTRLDDLVDYVLVLCDRNDSQSNNLSNEVFENVLSKYFTSYDEFKKFSKLPYADRLKFVTKHMSAPKTDDNGDGYAQCGFNYRRLSKALGDNDNTIKLNQVRVFIVGKILGLLLSTDVYDKTFYMELASLGFELTASLVNIPQQLVNLMDKLSNIEHRVLVSTNDQQVDSLEPLNDRLKELNLPSHDYFDFVVTPGDSDNYSKLYPTHHLMHDLLYHNDVKMKLSKDEVNMFRDFMINFRENTHSNVVITTHGTYSEAVVPSRFRAMWYLRRIRNQAQSNIFSAEVFELLAMLFTGSENVKVTNNNASQLMNRLSNWLRSYKVLDDAGIVEMMTRVVNTFVIKVFGINIFENHIERCNNLYVKVVEVYKKFVNIPNNVIKTDPKLRNELYEALGDCLTIGVIVGEHPRIKFSLPAYNAILNNISKMVKDTTVKDALEDTRVKPVFVRFSGPAGVGKTTTANMLAKDLAMRYSHIYKKKLAGYENVDKVYDLLDLTDAKSIAKTIGNVVYSVPQTSFWDNFSDQRIISWPEAFQSKIDQDRTNEYVRAVRMCDVATFNAPIANPDEMNTKTVKPDYLIMTTNAQDVPVANVESKFAFIRRIDFDVTLVKVPTSPIRDVNDNSSNIANTVENHSMYKVSRWHCVVNGSETNVNVSRDPEWVAKPFIWNGRDCAANPLTYRELLKLVISRHAEHVAEYNKTVLRDSSFITDLFREEDGLVGEAQMDDINNLSLLVCIGLATLFGVVFKKTVYDFCRRQGIMVQKLLTRSCEVLDNFDETIDMTQSLVSNIDETVDATNGVINDYGACLNSVKLSIKNIKKSYNHIWSKLKYVSIFIALLVLARETAPTVSKGISFFFKRTTKEVDPRLLASYGGKPKKYKGSPDSDDKDVDFRVKKYTELEKKEFEEARERMNREYVTEYDDELANRFMNSISKANLFNSHNSSNIDNRTFVIGRSQASDTIDNVDPEQLVPEDLLSRYVNTSCTIVMDLVSRIDNVARVHKQVCHGVAIGSNVILLPYHYFVRMSIPEYDSVNKSLIRTTDDPTLIPNQFVEKDGKSVRDPRKPWFHFYGSIEQHFALPMQNIIKNPVRDTNDLVAVILPVGVFHIRRRGDYITDSELVSLVGNISMNRGKCVMAQAIRKKVYDFVGEEYIGGTDVYIRNYVLNNPSIESSQRYNDGYSNSFYINNSITFTLDEGRSSKPGDCGSLYIAFTKAGPRIVGMHTFGGRSNVLGGVILTDSVVNDILHMCIDRTASWNRKVANGLPLYHFGDVIEIDDSCNSMELLAQSKPINSYARYSYEIPTERKEIINTKSKLRYSPFNEYITNEMGIQLFEPILKCDLSTAKDRVENALRKISLCDGFNCDERIIDYGLECVDMVYPYYMYKDIVDVDSEKLTRVCSGVLTIPEALNSSPDMGPINKNSSVGVTLRREAKGKGKHDFLVMDSDYVISDVDERVKSEMVKLLDTWVSGKVCPSLNVLCPKDETLPPNKDKVRLIQCIDFAYLVHFRRVFGRLIKAMHRSQPRSYSSVGINPHRDWTFLVRQFHNSDFQRVLAGDVSTYDWRIMQSLLFKCTEYVCKCTNDEFMDDGQYEEVLSYLLESPVFKAKYEAEPMVRADVVEIFKSVKRLMMLSLVYGIKTIGDKAFVVMGGVSSGWPLTAEFNSLITAVFVYASLGYRRSIPPSTLVCKTRVKTYGDDHLIGIRNDFDITMKEFVDNCWEMFHLKITMSDKTEEVIEGQNIFDVTFLGRYALEVSPSHYVGVLPKDNIYEQLRHMRSNNDVGFSCSILSAALEAAQYGEGFYNEFKNNVEKAMLSSGYVPTDPRTLYLPLRLPDFDFVEESFTETLFGGDKENRLYDRAGLLYSGSYHVSDNVEVNRSNDVVHFAQGPEVEITPVEIFVNLGLLCPLTEEAMKVAVAEFLRRTGDNIEVTFGFSTERYVSGIFGLIEFFNYVIFSPESESIFYTIFKRLPALSIHSVGDMNFANRLTRHTIFNSVVILVDILINATGVQRDDKTELAIIITAYLIAILVNYKHFKAFIDGVIENNYVGACYDKITDYVKSWFGQNNRLDNFAVEYGKFVNTDTNTVVTIVEKAIHNDIIDTINQDDLVTTQNIFNTRQSTTSVVNSADLERFKHLIDSNISNVAAFSVKSTQMDDTSNVTTLNMSTINTVVSSTDGIKIETSTVAPVEGVSYIPKSIDNIPTDTNEVLPGMLYTKIKLGTYTVSSGVSPSIVANLDPMAAILNDPRTRPSFMGKLFSNASFRVEVYMNTTYNIGGILNVSYSPGDGTDLYNIISDYRECANFPNTNLDYSKDTSCVVELPYASPYPVVKLDNYFYGAMGTVTLVNLVPPFNADGTTTSVTFTVYAQILKINLFGKTNVTLPTIPFMRSQGREGREKSEKGIISKTTTDVIKFVGETVKSVASNLAAIGTRAAITAITGMDKPLSLRAEEMVVQTIPNTSNSSGLFSGSKLSNDPEFTQGQDLGFCLPSIGGVQMDDMNISSLCSVAGLLDIFTWNASATVGSTLYTAYVNPKLVSSNFTTVESNGLISSFPTPLAMATIPFRRWSGSIKYRFHFVGTPTHSGRVKIQYTYCNEVASTLDNSMALDIRGSTVCDFVVPNMEPTEWSRQSSGYVTISIELPLTSANITTAAPMQVLVYVSSDDMRVAGYQGVYGVPYNACTVIPRETAQGLREDMSRPFKPLITDMCGVRLNRSTLEAITDVRDLLKLPQDELGRSISLDQGSSLYYYPFPNLNNRCYLVFNDGVNFYVSTTMSSYTPMGKSQVVPDPITHFQQLYMWYLGSMRCSFYGSYSDSVSNDYGIQPWQVNPTDARNANLGNGGCLVTSSDNDGVPHINHNYVLGSVDHKVIQVDVPSNSDLLVIPANYPSRIQQERLPQGVKLSQSANTQLFLNRITRQLGDDFRFYFIRGVKKQVFFQSGVTGSLHDFTMINPNALSATYIDSF